MTEAQATPTPKPPVAQRPPQAATESLVDQSPTVFEPQAGGKKPRTYEFTIPASCKKSPHDPDKIEIRELGPDDITKVKRINSKLGDEDSADEAVKFSLWSVNGKLVDHSQEEATIYWNRFSSKVRHLCTLAWGEIHASTKEEDEAFLGSMVAK